MSMDTLVFALVILVLAGVPNVLLVARARGWSKTRTFALVMSMGVAAGIAAGSVWFRRGASPEVILVWTLLPPGIIWVWSRTASGPDFYKRALATWGSGSTGGIVRPVQENCQLNLRSFAVLEDRQSLFALRGSGRLNYVVWIDRSAGGARLWRGYAKKNDANKVLSALEGDSASANWIRLTPVQFETVRENVRAIPSALARAVEASAVMREDSGAARVSSRFAQSEGSLSVPWCMPPSSGPTRIPVAGMWGLECSPPVHEAAERLLSIRSGADWLFSWVGLTKCAGVWSLVPFASKIETAEELEALLSESATPLPFLGAWVEHRGVEELESQLRSQHGEDVSGLVRVAIIGVCDGGSYCVMHTE